VEKQLFSLKEKSIPAIVSGTTLTDDGFTWSDIDAWGIFQHATKSLIREGHARIVFLDTVVGTCPRVYEQAFLDAVAKESGKNGREWVFRPERASLSNMRRVTQEALARMKEVTALLLTDNFYAEAVLDVLHQHGIHAGKGCRVIGCGDTILADRCSPKLSHYGLRIEEQVAFGLDALIESIRTPSAYHPRHKAFGPEYIPRET